MSPVRPLLFSVAVKQKTVGVAKSFFMLINYYLEV